MRPFKALKVFNIPRRILHDHLESDSLRKKLGRHSILSEHQETELEEYDVCAR